MTTSIGSYTIKDIQANLAANKKRYIHMCHAFTRCDTVGLIMGHGKSTLFTKLCNGPAIISNWLHVFLDPMWIKEDITITRISLFQFIYNSLGLELDIRPIMTYSPEGSN